MQNPQGQVISVNVDDACVTAVVEVNTMVACERCESGRGCGAGLLGSQSAGKRLEANVASDLQLKSGDTVRIVLEPGNVLRAAVLVYGYPLSGAVLAALVALMLGFGDVAAAVAALLGLLAGFLVARIQLRNTGCLKEFTPIIVDKLVVPEDSE